MPCKDSSHSHVWPTKGPAKFKLESCELICGYCENGKRCAEEQFSNVGALRIHVWSRQLGKEEFPFVGLLAGRNCRKLTSAQTIEKKRMRQDREDDMASREIGTTAEKKKQKNQQASEHVSPDTHAAAPTQPVKEKKQQQSSEHTSQRGNVFEAPKHQGTTYSSIWRALPNDFDQQAPLHRIRLLHHLLYLLLAHHTTFQRLVTRYFQEPINNQTIAERTTERRNNTIANEVADFLQKHGGSLWPSYLPRRAHLCTTPVRERFRRCWRGGKGPTFVLHARMTTVDAKRKWRTAHDGKDPSPEDELAASNFGEALQAYVSALLELGCLTDVPEISYDEVARLMSTIVGDGTSKPTVMAALSGDDPDVVSVLGDARFAPTAVRLLQEQPAMNMDQLRNLGRALQKCAAARIDFEVLTRELRAMTDERNASQCSQTLSGSAKTLKSSSRDSSPDVPLAHLRRLINTSAADPVEEFSAHEADCASQDHASRDHASRDRASRDRASRDRASRDRASRDRASRNSSPDTSLGDTIRHSGDACTLDKVLALNKAVANTLPPAAVISTTSTDQVIRGDDPAEPDFFQELLDANVEPMSADELQSAQDVLEASSIATATAAPKAQPSTIQASLKRTLPQRLMWQPLPHFPGNVRPFDISSPPRPDIRSSGSISAVSPRTVLPTLRPPPPPPDHARDISTGRVPPSLSLRSNAPAHPASAETFPVLASALPGPSTSQRQSYGHAMGASQLTWMGMPRRSVVAIAHTAPPLRASSDADQEVHRESSVSRQGSVAGGLSDREKTMLMQQFVDTGAMGGLPLVLPPRST